jgi:multidrug resistance efflux pump
MRSATSRERSSSGGSSRSASAGGIAAAASSTMGGEGLGSTSGSLFGGGGSSGGGGGGGGSTEFGSVLQDLIPAGAIVKKGQKIAEFDRQYMLQRLDDYKAGVEQQELNLVRQKASIEESRKAHEQSVAVAKAAVEKAKLDLKTVPVRSPMDAERFKLALEEAEARYKQVLAEVPHVRAGEEAQLKISELDLQQSKLEERRAEANADRMVMKAPIAGMAVMMRMFRGGEFGQSQVGDPVPAGYPFMQIVDTSSMIVNALVNQVDVERLRVGQKASVRFDAFPDLTLPGRVYSIAAMPRNSFSARASFLKEIPVTIKLEAMDPRVIPDLSVSADVLVGEEDAEAIAPLSAVFQEANGKPYAFVQTPEGWERRQVQLGRSSFTSVAIRSGLKAGEIVAEDRPNMGPAAPQKSALFVRRQPPRG